MSDDNVVVSPESEEREDEEHEPGATSASALDLGDVTWFGDVRNYEAQVGADGDEVDYYRFTLTQAREVRLGLRHREGEAALYLEDAAGTVLGRAVGYGHGLGVEATVRTLGPGTYYVRVEAQGTEPSAHQFKVRTAEPYAVYGDGGVLAQRLGLPSFGEWSRGLSLSENVDGSEARVSLGTVSATDPNEEALHYALVGGNESRRFAIDGASGELSYVGTGEDYETGAGPYELTVRASDGTHTVDATVTVTVTDAPEAPEFSASSYAFELAENTDGSEARISLGTVQAADPDGDTVHYTLVGGNESGLFAIDESSGELSYAGAGEDFESITGPYELTVRASDGTHTVDATVTVTVTDAPEAPEFSASSYAFELAENTDGSEARISLGTVQATDPDGGDTLRYALVGGNESGLFAVDGASGELSYAGTGEDFESITGPYELTVRASDGTHTVDTPVTVTVTDAPEAPEFSASGYAFELAENTDGSEARISLGTVQATDPDGGDTLRYTLVGGNESGLFAIDGASGELYYVGAGEDYESGAGPYELTVRASDGTHTVDTPVTVTVTDAPEAPEFSASSYAFELAENTDGSEARISLGTVHATDPDGGDTLRYTLVGGNESGRFAVDGASGELYYVGAGEDYESGAGPYELTVRASDGTHTVDTPVMVTVTDAPEAPEFSASGYAFELAENTDGSATRVSLGTVSAADPDGDTLRYTLVGGNESGRFAVDEASGELSYVGAGENYESVSSHELTVRASDGTHTVDTPVTVTVTNAPEAPEFAASSYAFELAENTDGSATRVSLGTVSAADPDGDSLHYTLAAGNASGLFAVDEASGELYYVGTGEDYESGAPPYELTVRASDGAHSVDATVTVTIAAFDKEGAPQGTSEPEGEDLPAGRSTSGEVLVGAEPVKGKLRSSSDRDWFEVNLAPGRTYQFDIEGDVPGGSTVPVIRGLRDSNGNPVPDIEGGPEVRYTTDANDSEAVYYVEVGGSGNPGQSQSSSMSRGLGTLSIAIAPLGSNDETGSYRLRGHDITETRDVTDDYTSDTTTKGVVAVDGSVTATIERPGDHDWFEMTLVAGRVYRIDLEGSSTGAGTLAKPYIRGVHTSLGDLVGGTMDFAGGVGTNSRVWFAPETDGIHYVAASGFGRSRGTYKLSVTQAPDDYQANVDTTGTAAPGEPVMGEIQNPGDQDWFEITLRAGHLYRFDLQGASSDGGTLLNPYLRGIFDSNGELIDGTTDYSSGQGLDSRVFFEASETATYYVAVGSSGNRSGTYTLSVVEATDQYPADTSTSGEIAVGSSIMSNIWQPGDQDWFSVTLQEGKYYRFDQNGSFSDDGTLIGPSLRGIYDADGNLIDGTTYQREGYVRNSRVIFEAPESATYYVAAGAYRAYLGTYTLSVTVIDRDTETGDRDGDDYRADILTTGMVTVGGSITGDIETKFDRDWFEVTLEAGRVYRIDLEGVSTRAGNLNSPSIHRIYDSFGYWIDGTTDSGGGEGRNSRVWFTPEADGTYYVAASGFFKSQGTYKLSVTQAADDHRASVDTTGTVAIGMPATGEIQSPRDVDWFGVTLTADTTYRFLLEGDETGEGTLDSPRVGGVYDASGNQVGRKSSNDMLKFTPEVDGTYYVAATGRGNGQGTYKLSVFEGSDDFEANDGTSGTVVVGGKTRGEIDHAYDRDWFAVTLETDKRYWIELTGGWDGTGNVERALVDVIRDADGNVEYSLVSWIIVYDDGSRNFGHHHHKVLFEPDASGIYFVDVRSTNHIQTGSYTLSVEEVVDAM